MDAAVEQRRHENPKLKTRQLDESGNSREEAHEAQILSALCNLCNPFNAFSSLVAAVLRPLRLFAAGYVFCILPSSFRLPAGPLSASIGLGWLETIRLRGRFRVCFQALHGAIGSLVSIRETSEVR